VESRRQVAAILEDQQLAAALLGPDRGPHEEFARDGAHCSEEVRRLLDAQVEFAEFVDARILARETVAALDALRVGDPTEGVAGELLFGQIQDGAEIAAGRFASVGDEERRETATAELAERRDHADDLGRDVMDEDDLDIGERLSGLPTFDERCQAGHPREETPHAAALSSPTKAHV
jgi:hypothetical protein